jgi:hypothetical protein
MKTVVHLDVKEVCNVISASLLSKFPGKNVVTRAVLEMVPGGAGCEEMVPSVRFESDVLDDVSQR